MHLLYNHFVKGGEGGQEEVTGKFDTRKILAEGKVTGKVKGKRERVIYI